MVKWITRKQGRFKIDGYTRHYRLLILVLSIQNLVSLLPLIAAVPAFAFMINEVGGTLLWLSITMLILLSPWGLAVFVSYRFLFKGRPALAFAIASLPLLCEAILFLLSANR
jgi:hypothetical protein